MSRLEDFKCCFRCGEQGHEQRECSLDSQTAAGREAFITYQEKWKELHQAQKAKKKKKQKFHYFWKLQKWLADKDIALEDPVSSVHKEINKSDDSVGFELKKMLQLCYREVLMDILTKTRMGFLGKSTKKDHDKLWEKVLNDAARCGEPADFSRFETNLVYADNKLVFRTRYLCQLLLDNNPFSAKLRKLLMSTKHIEGISHQLYVASIGGGPGYDHFALCLVTWLLWWSYFRYEVFVVPPSLNTVVVELHHDAWESIARDIESCFRVEMINSECNVDGLSVGTSESVYSVKDWLNSNNMDIVYGDLRNSEARMQLNEIDIYVCQFVLLENSSHIVDRVTGTISGLLASILERAKIGAFLVCTDSGNRVWPSIQRFGHENGWISWSDTDRSNEGGICFGPKSFLIMERKDRGNTSN